MIKLCALILLKTWRYISRLLTYLLTYLLTCCSCNLGDKVLKIFLKLELRKIHIFILRYSFIQLLLIYQKTIHMYSSRDRLHRINASEQKMIYNCLKISGGTKKGQHIYQFVIMWSIHFDSLSIRRPRYVTQLVSKISLSLGNDLILAVGLSHFQISQTPCTNKIKISQSNNPFS